MDLITLDFECFYDDKYSLKKLTIEEYIKSPLFEVVGVGWKVNNGGEYWFSGTHEEIRAHLDLLPIRDSAVLCHNTVLDGAILSWCFDMPPKVYLDTLSMARGLHDQNEDLSLAALSQKYALGEKGKEVEAAKGLRRVDFPTEQLAEYGEYCKMDVALTRKLFNKFISLGFHKEELKIVDCTLRMFCEPIFTLDVEKLEGHKEYINKVRKEAVDSVGLSETLLRSAPKFAEYLRSLGVEPPTKISPRTKKEAYAFAKDDAGFKALLVHEDPHIRKVAKVKQEVSSSLEKSRTQRFLDIASRGYYLPGPIKYYAAHTGRWGGMDKINLQNLPSRGPYGKVLKKTMIAPKGYKVVDCDSAQIEARILAWFAGQLDLVLDFKRKRDVYKKQAGKIYHKDAEDVTSAERFLGKQTILGCGYQMGAERFQVQLATYDVYIPLTEAEHIINIYRESNPEIKRMWYKCQDILKYMVNGAHRNVRGAVGAGIALNWGADVEEITYRNGVTKPCVTGWIEQPNGLKIYYKDLKVKAGERGPEYTYQARDGVKKIYGGKVVENICQALARCVIGTQIVDISKKTPVALTVHDSIVACIQDQFIDKAGKYIVECMSKTPDWAEGLPLDCDIGIGDSYGEAAENAG